MNVLNLFSKRNNLAIKVVAGPEKQWVEQAKLNADLLFRGAEYMLTQFAFDHPGFVDISSRTELYKRAAGILARPGNPKKIKSMNIDLL